MTILSSTRLTYHCDQVFGLTHTLSVIGKGLKIAKLVRPYWLEIVVAALMVKPMASSIVLKADILGTASIANHTLSVGY